MVASPVRCLPPLLLLASVALACGSDDSPGLGLGEEAVGGASAGRAGSAGEAGSKASAGSGAGVGGAGLGGGGDAGSAGSGAGGTNAGTGGTSAGIGGSTGVGGGGGSASGEAGAGGMAGEAGSSGGAGASGTGGAAGAAALRTNIGTPVLLGVRSDSNRTTFGLFHATPTHLAFLVRENSDAFFFAKSASFATLETEPSGIPDPAHDMKADPVPGSNKVFVAGYNLTSSKGYIASFVPGKTGYEILHTFATPSDGPYLRLAVSTTHVCATSENNTECVARATGATLIGPKLDDTFALAMSTKALYAVQAAPLQSSVLTRWGLEGTATKQVLAAVSSSLQITGDTLWAPGRSDGKLYVGHEGELGYQAVPLPLAADQSLGPTATRDHDGFAFVDSPTQRDLVHFTEQGTMTVIALNLCRYSTELLFAGDSLVWVCSDHNILRAPLQ